MKLQNRLDGCTCYLCGPMDMAKDGGVGWRDEITPKLQKMGIRVLDPCKKPSTMGIMQDESKARENMRKWKETGKFGKIRPAYKMIRSIDLRCVDESSFLIGYINTDVFMCGTIEEISVANRSKKPVLLCIEGGKAKCPNWLLLMLDHRHIFGSWDELLSYLQKINKGRVATWDNRWIFFDWGKKK